MRFLFVEHHPVFGGPHNQALRLAAPLSDRGWETLAVVPDEPGNAADRLRAGGVPVLAMPLTRIRRTIDPRVHARVARRAATDIRSLRGVIRRERVGLVVAAGVENPHAAFAARAEGVPMIWQINGTQTPPAFRRAVMPLVRRLASVVMTTGTTIAPEYPGVVGLGRRWVPFFAPVDVEEFRPDPSRRLAARAELGFAPEATVVGTVANLNPQKDHLTFIRAAAELRRTHPTVRFAVLGASHDTHRDYEERLRREARSLGLALDEDLIVRAPEDRVSALAPALDVFWSSSRPRSEGVPTAVSEAMALGIPVAATDAGGTRDLVRDGENGFLVPPRAPTALADRTRAILDQPQLARRLSAAGRRAAVEECSTEVCAEVHVEAFERALSVGPSGGF